MGDQVRNKMGEMKMAWLRWMKLQVHDNSGQKQCGQLAPQQRSRTPADRRVLRGASAHGRASVASEFCTCQKYLGGVHRWQRVAAPEALQKTGALREHARDI